ncbi:hypothetical protein ACOZ38_25420 [Sphaerisporangium viridialbum]|uniref:hypothetical protein n=1 Tax=Sphaerisporangium viridialbum TaxID=46189 RepID=UPI003C732D9A
MSSPAPGGCRWCGADKQGHCQRFEHAAGWHKWTPPTDKQIKARMLARRSNAGKDAE